MKHKKLIENFGYLTLLQVVNYVFPLLSYPYLIRVVGPSKYGEVVLAQTYMIYALILVKFGFDISATASISKNKNDKEFVNKLCSSVLILKSILSLFVFVILISWLLIFGHFENYSKLYLFAYLMCVSDVLFPQWYFLGTEKMKYITIINAIIKIIFFGLIFTFIHNQNDYLYIPLLNGIGGVLGGGFALWVMVKKEKVRFTKVDYNFLKQTMSDSIHLFGGNVSIQIYNSIGKIIAGTFIGVASLAYYDLADKIVRLCKVPLGIITQALFPKAVKEGQLSFIKKMMWITLLVSGAGVGLFFLIGDHLIVRFAGQEMKSAAIFVKILMLTVIFSSVNIYLGSLMLLASGYKKEYSRALYISVLVFSLIIFLLYTNKMITLNSLIWTNVAAEFSITVVFLIECIRKKIIIVKPQA